MCTKRKNFRCKNGFAPDDRLRYSNGGGGAQVDETHLQFFMSFFILFAPLYLLF